MQTETVHTGRNKTLPGRLWSGDTLPIAVITVVHGLGDHSGRYEAFAREAVASNLAVFAFDLPGHGLSPGRRGHFDRYSDVLEDIHAARATVSRRFPDAPQFILGHSMGGNLAINYVLRRTSFDEANAGELAGLILAAPMLLPPNPPARPQIIAAWITGHLFPWIKFRRKLAAPRQSSAIDQLNSPQPDPQPDPLLHCEITIYVATQLLAQGRWALDNARQIDIPTLVIDCEDDLQIDRAASENVAIRIGQHAMHISLTEGGHNLLHELEAPAASQKTIQWIIETLDG